MARTSRAKRPSRAPNRKPVLPRSTTPTLPTGSRTAPEQNGARRALAAAQYRLREGHLLLVDDATSARMGLVRQKGTRPERLVRAALAALGHHFRLANRDLPGSPDMANRSRRWAVFVHGCFWHRHGCKATTTPARNREFWEAKFARNVARDQRSADELCARGYTVIVIWECETKRGLDAVREALARVLSPAP